MALSTLKQSLEDSCLEASRLSAESRRLSENARKVRSRRASADQRLEDRAFSLYCRHDWNDPCLRLCFERIVSHSLGLDVQTLLRYVQDRYLRTPLEDIAGVSEGRGGGIADLEHARASKLWREMAAVAWVHQENEVHGIAPSWEHISKKLSEPFAESADGEMFEMSFPPHPRTLAKRVHRLAQVHELSFGHVEPTLPLPQEVARYKATSLLG